MRLEGKVAIVTGAGSGFGKAIAERLAAEGAAVVLSDINEPGVEPVAKALSAKGCEARHIVADVSDSDDVGRMVATAVDAYGGLDIIVNNAGYTHDRGPMTGVPVEEFDRVFAVNVKALYHAAVYAVPELRRRGGGSIVNIGSTAAVRPGRNLVWYTASKGAVITATKAMAMELADDRIRVNVLNPFAGETGLMHKFLGTSAGPEVKQAVEAMVPLNRLCQPRDVANVALFVVSDDAEYLTGQQFDVDGGWLGGWYLRSAARQQSGAGR